MAVSFVEFSVGISQLALTNMHQLLALQDMIESVLRAKVDESMEVKVEPVWFDGVFKGSEDE